MAYKRKMLDIEQLSNVAGVSQATMRKWMRDFNAGKDVDIFPFVQVNGRYFANAEDVERWYENKYRNAGFATNAQVVEEEE